MKHLLYITLVKEVTLLSWRPCNRRRAEVHAAPILASIEASADGMVISI